MLACRLGGRSGPAVAHELSMTVTAVLMAKSRVQKKLRQEIQRLELDGSSGHESLYSPGPALPPGGRPN
jgi:hypothetical protein